MPKNSRRPQLRLVTAASASLNEAAPADDALLPDDAVGWTEAPPDSSLPSGTRRASPARQDSRFVRKDAAAASYSDAPGESAPFARESACPSSPLPEDLSDAQLVALARVNQRAAFEALYRRHASYVLALTVRMQGNASDAEDIVHDAFMKVLGRLSELRDGDAFRFWLAKVAANLVRTRMRRRRVLGVLGFCDGEPVDLELLVSFEAGPEQRVQLAQVYECLRQVTVDQRLAWILRYVEGHKLEEVAQVSGCSLATAKRRIATAQQKISAAAALGSGQ